MFCSLLSAFVGDVYICNMYVYFCISQGSWFLDGKPCLYGEPVVSGVRCRNFTEETTVDLCLFGGIVYFDLYF